jgi:hypothetical protein
LVILKILKILKNSMTLIKEGGPQKILFGRMVGI